MTAQLHLFDLAAPAAADDLSDLIENGDELARQVAERGDPLPAPACACGRPWPDPDLDDCRCRKCGHPINQPERTT